MENYASDRFSRLVHFLKLVTAILCGAFLLAMTFVTLIDVVGRYVMSQPLPGASEYTSFLLLAIIFVGLPAICLSDSHVCVDLLTLRLRGRPAGIQLFVSRLVVAVALAVVAWRIWEHGVNLSAYNEQTMYLRVPLGTVAKAVAVLSGASALISVAMALARFPRN